MQENYPQEPWKPEAKGGVSPLKETRHQVNPCIVFEHEKASVMVKSLHNAGLLIFFEHGSLSILIIRFLNGFVQLAWLN